jgi:AcrR family transcriptional regulator
MASTESARATEPTRASRLPRDQRRAQLLEAASEVFGAVGYHAAAMDDIAERAGVSKPVLYQHFGSKLELYLDLLDRTCDRMVETINTALASTPDNADRVAATMDAFFDFVAAPGNDFRFVFESDLTGEAAVTQRLERMNEVIAAAIAAVIAEDTGQGPAESRLLAVALVGLAQVSARYWVDSSGTLDATAAKRLTGSLAWRGISGFPLTDHHG